MSHDTSCERGYVHPGFNRPPVGECWCADRALGYAHWIFSGGASNCEMSKVPEGELPPNVGGVP